MSFPCTSCGACCKMARHYVESMPEDQVENPDSPFYFPFGFDASGACEKLNEDNKCSVYEDRPDICRIDVRAKMFKEKFGIGKQQYHLMSARACAELIRKQGIDPSMIPDLKNKTKVSLN